MEKEPTVCHKLTTNVSGKVCMGEINGTPCAVKHIKVKDDVGEHLTHHEIGVLRF